jgi:Divergent InlB B-repeat domain
MFSRLFSLAATGLIASAVILVLPAATSAAAPEVSTTNAEVFGDAATSVFGVVNPEGETTTYYVAYAVQSSAWCSSGGTSGTPAFTTTPVQMVNSSPQYDDAGAQLTGLNFDTEYCAELIASNASGEIDGGQVAWWQGQPRIDNTDVFPTGLSTATVDAQVNPGGQNLSYEVLYGPASSSWCTSGGTSGSPPDATRYTSIGSTDNSFHQASVSLTGLTLGSEYCAAFLVFGNSYLRTYGEQVTWSQSPPAADTYDTYSTGASTATVEGDVNPAGDATTTYQVWYDLAGSDWCTSGGTSSSPANTTSPTSAGLDNTQSTYQFVSVNLTGLTEGSDYCAELIATNSNGEADGGQVAWTQGTPFADTFEIDPTGDSTATLDGDVNPALQTTTYVVHYDLAGSQWCESGGTSGSPAATTATATLGFTDGSFHEVTVDISALAAGASYCGQLVATNAVGTSEGGQVSWTQPTPPPPSPTLTVHVDGAGRVTSSPAGIDCTSTCAATFAPGTRVTLTATGGTFFRWGGAIECFPLGSATPGPTCTITLNSDRSVSAFFAAPPPPTTHGLFIQLSGNGSGTVMSTPAGINCGSACSSSFAIGSQVTLTATTSTGSSFGGWSGGDCPLRGKSCVVTMTADTIVTAIFTKNLPPRARCTLKSSGSKVNLTGAKVGVLTLRAMCDQSVYFSLAGRVTIKIKMGATTKTSHVALRTVQGHAKAGVLHAVSLKLPKSALTKLRQHASESVAFVLTARNANGTTKASASIKRLRG